MDTNDKLEGQIFADYRLTKFLANGAFGVVYKGENVNNAQDIKAIKIWHLDMVAHFDHERQVFENLTPHPNIVRYNFSGKKDGRPFIVMEYIPGDNLSNTYRTNQPSQRQIIGYVDQVAAALQHLHNHGFIHGDVKPEHLLKDERDRIFLCDFGMTIRIEDGPQPIRIPDNQTNRSSYQAPEQINGGPHSGTDQYALAMIVYKWLTGKLPFAGSDMKEAIINETPPPLDGDGSKISGAINEVIQKALNKNPEKRYNSVIVFADALRTAFHRSQSEKESSLKASLSASPTSQPLSPLDDSHTPAKLKSPSRRRILGGVLETTTTIGTSSFLLLSWLRLRTEIPTVFQAATPVPGSITVLPKFPQKYTINVYRGHMGDLRYGNANDPKGNVNGVAWEPREGLRVASASSDKTVQIWDATNGDNLQVYTRHIEHVNDVTWSPDGTKIASCSGESGGQDFTVHIWNAKNAVPIAICHGHTRPVNAVSWSPDSTMVASASYDGTVRIWDATSGRPILSYSMSSPISTVAWSPDGQYIASGALKSGPNAQVHIWEAKNGTLHLLFAGHTDDVLSVSWFPYLDRNEDHQVIASASRDTTVKIWNFPGGTISHTGNLNGPVRRVAWSLDGKNIAICADGIVQVWDTEKYAEFVPNGYSDYQPNVIINALAWSPGNSMIASGGTDKTVHVWQVTST